MLCYFVFSEASQRVVPVRVNCDLSLFNLSYITSGFQRLSKLVISFMLKSSLNALPPLCSLMIPFLRLGESITGGPHFPLTTDALKKVFTGEASKEVLLSILRAVSEEVFASEHLFLSFLNQYHLLDC